MNTVLLKDEKEIKKTAFATNLLLFWLKADFTLTNKRVLWKAPNTLLGLIPLGKNNLSQPLNTIASVFSSTKFYFKRFILAIIFLVIAYSMSNILFLILGVVNLLNSYTATLVINNNGGKSLWCEVSIIDKSKVEAFVNEVNVQMADL